MMREKALQNAENRSEKAGPYPRKAVHLSFPSSPYSRRHSAAPFLVDLRRSGCSDREVDNTSKHFEYVTKIPRFQPLNMSALAKVVFAERAPVYVAIWRGLATRGCTKGFYLT